MGDSHDRNGAQAQPMQSQRPPIERMVSVLVILGLLACPNFLQASSFKAGSLPSEPNRTVNCSNPVMTSAPKFLTSPAGAAKYPFTLTCNSPTVQGVISVVMEGSWTPSETRRDRPNASESVTIKGYEPFLPDRAPGGTIFMYWTGSCTADPWLQGGTCSRFGEYIPDDLRPIFTNIVSRPFPLTGNAISSSLKQQLVTQYQAMNPPNSARSNTQQGQSKFLPQSQIITQAQRDRAVTVQPQLALPKPNSRVSGLAQSGIMARGVEADAQETSDMATVEEAPGGLDGPALLTLDRPLHVMSDSGADIVLKPGIYEVGPVMDLQVGIASMGQPTVLLHAEKTTHDESVSQSTLLTIPGRSEDLELVLLTPDGRRFDVRGSFSGARSRGVDPTGALPDNPVKDALRSAQMTSRSILPACQPNPDDIGPRWVPVPCTMPTAASGGTP